MRWFILAFGLLFGSLGATVRSSHEEAWLHEEAVQRLANVVAVARKEAALYPEVWQERSLKPIKTIVASWPKETLRLSIWDTDGLYWQWGELPADGYSVIVPVVGRTGPAGAVSIELDVTAALNLVHAIVGVWILLFGLGFSLYDRRRQRIDNQLAMGRLSVDAQETERRRLAQELHDTIGQDLAVLSMIVGGDDPAAASEASRRAIVDLRRIVADLHPIELETGALDVAVEALCLRLQKATGRGIERAIDDVGTVPVHEATALFRVAQEALSNAVKHGHEEGIRLELSRQDGDLRLTVTNRANEKGGDGGGHGLTFMAARIEHFGGTFSAGTNQEGQWCLQACIPS